MLATPRARGAAWKALLLFCFVFLCGAGASRWGPGSDLNPLLLGHHARGLLSNSSSAEKCLTDNINTVLYSCPGTNGNGPASAGTTPNRRDAMIRLLQSCVLGGGSAQNSSSETMRILMPSGVIGAIITNLTSVYSATTSIPIQASAVSPLSYTTVRLASLQNAARPNLTHEMWLVTPSAIGDGLAANAYMDLSDLVLYDQRLQWPGIINQMRSVGLVYGSKVVSLPLSSYSFQLFYRMDTFKANNWTVPRTWRRLAEQAVRMNGTDNKWGFCGAWGPCGQLGTNLIKYILASYHQTHGATQGWLLDPDSMRLMLDSPAVVEALDILRALYQASPVDNSLSQNCLLSSGAFQSGQCHMTITWGTTFKLLSHAGMDPVANFTSSVIGNLGVEPVPGTSRVLDRATNKLVACNEAICPYATRFVFANGSISWINNSPGFEATLMPLNEQSSETMKFYSYSVGSYLAREDTNDVMVFSRTAEVLPSRTSQLQPARWQSAGYNLDDATRYCAAHAAAMSHPNLHVQIRIPGASDFITLFSSLITAVMGNASTADIAASAQPRGLAILDSTFKGNKTKLMMQYWSSINKVIPSPPPSPPAPQPPLPPYQDPNSQSGISSNEVIIVIVCTIVPVTLLLAFGLWRFYGGGGVMGGVKPPGAGPNTCLLVTDIEGSTTLWEEVDAAVMDLSVKLHDACIRKVAIKHRGYESVWEGDSFVMAFPSALSALNCSLEIQKTLLHLDWPIALLANQRAEECWLTLNKAGGKGDVAAIQAALQYQANSSTMSRPTWGTGVRNAFPFAPTTANTSFALSTCGASTAPGQAVNASQEHVTENESPFINRITANGGELRPAVMRFQAQISLSSVFRTAGSFALNMPMSPGSALMTPPSFIGNNHNDGPSQLSHFSRGDSSKGQPLLTGSEDSGTMQAMQPPKISTAGTVDEDLLNSPPELHGTAVGGPSSYTEGGAVAAPGTAASFMARTLDGRRWPLRNKWAHKWSVCAAPNGRGSTGTLVFRGLRVRIGFHAGVTTEPDYNKSSRKYLYSGAIRIISNAVAFSGHGGFITLSTSTAQLLGRDNHGVLRLLPSDCHVYHMGNHTLTDVPGGPMEILMMLPAAMRCLLAIQQAPMRTADCVVPGILDAPAPPPSWAAGLLPEPILVAVQTSGLHTLLAWNKEEAFEAIRVMVQAANAELVEWMGVMSEDGLSLVLQTGACDQSRIAGVFKAVVPGRMVVAFHDAACALRWALALRHRLLTYPWSEELLAHEMCEQVGDLTAEEGENVLMCAYRELSMGTGGRHVSEKGDAVVLGASGKSKKHVTILQTPQGSSRMRASFAGLDSENGAVFNKQSSFGDRHQDALSTWEETDVNEIQRRPLSNMGPIPEKEVAVAVTQRQGKPGTDIAGLDSNVAGTQRGQSEPHICLELQPEDEEDEEARSSRSTLRTNSNRTTPGMMRTNSAQRNTAQQAAPPAPPEPEPIASTFKRVVQRTIAPAIMNLKNRAQTEPAVAAAHPDAAPATMLRTQTVTRLAKGPSSASQQPLSLQGSTAMPDYLNRRFSSGMPLASQNYWSSVTTNGGPELQGRVSGSAAVPQPTRSMAGQATHDSGASTVFAFDTGMLRGLRLRIAAVAGPSSVQIATNSTGRAVYRGAAVKQMHKLLQQAHVGQLLVTGNVMQQAQLQ